MHLKLYEMHDRLLRSHKVKELGKCRKGTMFAVECCKKYLLRVEFDLASGCWYYLRIEDDNCYPCDYHSNCDLTVEEKYLIGNTMYVCVSFHKLAHCPCFVTFRCYFGPPRRSECVVIGVDSANMLNIPSQGKAVARWDSCWEAINYP
jgi:hypothetical protein